MTRHAADQRLLLSGDSISSSNMSMEDKYRLLRSSIDDDKKITRRRCQEAEGEIYGQALNNAYYLETSVAIYPRIVIGQGVMEYLDSFSSFTLEEFLEGHKGADIESSAYYVQEIHRLAAKDMNLAKTACRFLEKSAELSKELIMQDCDGLPVLHYLARKMADGVGESRISLFDAAFRFIKSQKDDFLKQHNQKLIMKYGYLEKYFDAHRSYWR